MSYQESAVAYGAAAAAGATQGALTQLVYQYLAKDLITAAVAIEKGDISGRCRACQHALLLLGHLESWVLYVDDRCLADSLRAFYQVLRQSVLRDSAMLESDSLRQLAQETLDTGTAWKTKEALLHLQPDNGTVLALSREELNWSV